MLAKTTRLALVTLSAAVALSGCATTGSVKRAQATADQALALARENAGGVQRAQSSADNAGTAAQRAQASADAAAQAAQGAQTSANGAAADARSANDRLGRVEAGMHRLEKRVAEHKPHHGKHHRHGQGCKVAKPKKAKAAQ